MGDFLVPPVNFPGCTLPKNKRFASETRPPKRKDCPSQAPFFRGYVSNEKNFGCLGYIGDEILPNYMGIFISQYKDPYKPTSIMESTL